jgi:hypothetical protein
MGDYDIRIPEDSLITDYSIDVLLGSRDDGSSNLVVRVTDQAHGTITWILIGKPQNARRLGDRLLAMADQLEEAQGAEADHE